MNELRRTSLCFMVGALTAFAHGGFSDPAGDTLLRRTDFGADAPVINPTGLPDITGLELHGWLPDDPSQDRYTGMIDPSESPEMLRLVLTFDGLVSPPGPLGLSGLPYDPNKFGPNPVYGFVEMDLDQENDTGGEEAAVAINRFLANAARFGSIPSGVEDDRMILEPGDFDLNYSTEPRFERTGAELVLAMCGCWDLVVLDEGGAPDGQFDAGDSWIVSGRFLERAQGFECLSLVFGNASNGGPSSFGQYDPVTEARFTHDTKNDQSTLEIVFPLTPLGAALLAGEAQQPIDFTFGGGNHFSLEEALVDLQLGATTATGMCGDFSYEWDELELHPGPGEDIRPLDPTTWRAKAMIGTAYQVPQPDAIYAWTDTAFGDIFGDVDDSGVVDDHDRSDIMSEIDDHDGSGEDTDGQQDGRWTYAGFGREFSLYDLSYDGAVGPEDLALVAACRADLAAPFGTLDLADIAAFVTGFTTLDPIADLSGDGLFDLTDITQFIGSFNQGCGP